MLSFLKWLNAANRPLVNIFSLKQIIILGAGLSGLTTAYLLKKKGISAHILEARNRYGGRIFTEYDEQNTPVEMGATWLSSEHRELLALMKELNVHVFPQAMEGISLFEAMSMAPPQPFHIPESTEPSFRIQHGTSHLISTLVQSIGEEHISLNTTVTSLDFRKDKVNVHTSTKEIEADVVINTIPPHLALQSIEFTPGAPDALKKVASKTQTWMASSIKFAITYETPFWRVDGFSGTAFSNSGIAGEIYDHANVEDDRFAILGFLSEGAYTLSKKDRKEKLLTQLEKYFGKKARNYRNYHEVLWKDELHTSINNSAFLLPHHNNGHKMYLQSYFNDRLYFAGTETSFLFPGYMEGAVISAQRVANVCS